MALDPDINETRDAETTTSAHKASEDGQVKEGSQADVDAIPQSEQLSDEKPHQDVPPDGGYGWICVACAAFINGNTWGVNSVRFVLSLLFAPSC